MPHFLIAEDLLAAIGVSTIAAALLALLARRIGQPLILGYIVGGVLLGPQLGLGIVRNREAIDLIAEIGLILLLFIVGLEINVREVARAGRVIMVSGLLQFPLCVALAWPFLGGIAAATGGPLDRLYLAVGLALSSTLIVVKVLHDKFELSTFGGRVTLGILVFQDLWAILFLAFQPNLNALGPGALLRSAAAGVGLVAAAVVMSRHVLPSLFRFIARSPELMLVASMAWCFLVAGTAGRLGLSTAMGALVAGLVIAAFPYSTEVIGRLSGVRDFFITLFFVALGLKIPIPSVRLVAVALALTVFVAASRMITVLPLLKLLGLDTRTSAVAAINLSQVSEFSLVIVAIGAGLGHSSPAAEALVLYTLLFTAVLSTYAITFNHALASGLARGLERIGLARWRTRRASPAPEPAPPERPSHQIFLLGVAREGIALLEQLDRESPALKEFVVAIDFNPHTLERLTALGFDCHYGDIANPETLRHAGLERAAVVVSSVSDWMLKGTSNARVLRQARLLAPAAKVIVSADTMAGAEQLYADGADYVLMAPVLAAEHLYEILRARTLDAIDEARRRQELEIGLRTTPR
ncbi:MAG TPA: cation:proton antiporter [Candidatus Acidoferrum sp.]|nr:cation:proton antiporter [Candidatus Acidoferrum sp.]